MFVVEQNKQIIFDLRQKYYRITFKSKEEPYTIYINRREIDGKISFKYPLGVFSCLDQAKGVYHSIKALEMLKRESPDMVYGMIYSIPNDGEDEDMDAVLRS